MKVLSLIVSFLWYCLPAFSQLSRVSMKDLQALAGNWQGNLSYLDYTNNIKQQIPASLNIRSLEKSRMLLLLNSYANEPKANSVDTLSISEDGKRINSEVVKSVSLLKNGKTEIITTYLGADGNDSKPAIIRHAYIIGKSTFVRRKEVQFIGESGWIERSTYSYVRK